MNKIKTRLKRGKREKRREKYEGSTKITGKSENTKELKKVGKREKKGQSPSHFQWRKKL